jgi:hypothetical protein
MSASIVIKLLATSVLVICSIDSALPAEPPTIRAEVIKTISAKALWHSLDPIVFFSPGGAAVAYWATDVENRLFDGDWASPGIAMVGLGEIDERPVAIRIWTNDSDDFLEEQSRAESKSDKDAVVLFGNAGGEIRLRLSATPSGEVSINGTKIGTVGDE